MSTTVVVPWKAGCPHRERALAYTLPLLRDLADQVVVGEIDGEWCKAAAVAKGLEEATGEFLAIVDADVFIDDDWLTDAVDGLERAEWVVPHLMVRRLDRNGTEAVYRDRGARTLEASHEGRAGGGVVVMRHELYDRVPLDRRYTDWGQEDESWALALRCLAGPPLRRRRPLWHLWHPPQERLDRRWGSYESMALFTRYQSAKDSPERMTALIEEAR